MSLKLRIASFWIPESLLIKELDRVAKLTISELDKVLKEYAGDSHFLGTEDYMLNGDITERRAAMAAAHNVRVNALVNAIGYNKAIKIGREAMFRAGERLGQDARGRFGVGESRQDLILAARILYKVLGIDFEVKEQNGNIILLIQRCALANYYLLETCKVLSAADEGVVRGLNENFTMAFRERITEGAPECIAIIELKDLK